MSQYFAVGAHCVLSQGTLPLLPFFWFSHKTSAEFFFAFLAKFLPVFGIFVIFFGLLILGLSDTFQVQDHHTSAHHSILFIRGHLIFDFHTLLLSF